MTTINGDDDSYDTINKTWSKIWRNADDNIHRDGDFPAVIWPDGTLFYCTNGKCHRDGGLPAVIYADGREEYWIEGVLQK